MEGVRASHLRHLGRPVGADGSAVIPLAQALAPAVDDDASSVRTILAALVGNLAIAIAKYAAAGVTGSSAMLSEAIHSTVDTGNELLLLYGLRRAKRPADPEHPFGHGWQLYFWTFVVAVMIFGLGAVVALFQCVHKLSDRHSVAHVYVNYVVLRVSIVFEFGS